MTTETDTPETNVSEEATHPFEKGLAMYEAKEDYAKVIATFEEGITLSPRDSVGYTCLAWLLLLRNDSGDSQQAEKLCQQALRLDPSNYQAHFNLVLAMLENKSKGVRQEFQQAKRKLQTPDDKAELITNLEEAVSREPEFTPAQKVLNWIQNP